MNNSIQKEKKTVHIEATPNPQVYRFHWGEKITENSIEIKNCDEASQSPLATKIFGFPWAQSVFIGTHFITIEKQDWVDWSVLAKPLAQLIEEHLESEEPILFSPDSNDEENKSTTLMDKIKWVLNHEIRPALAVDGGDVQFISLDQGYLKIAMRGACSGCPSSQITLKQGIETHIKNLFPEIISVDAI